MSCSQLDWAYLSDLRLICAELSLFSGILIMKFCSWELGYVSEGLPCLSPYQSTYLQTNLTRNCIRETLTKYMLLRWNSAQPGALFVAPPKGCFGLSASFWTSDPFLELQHVEYYVKIQKIPLYLQFDQFQQTLESLHARIYGACMLACLGSIIWPDMSCMFHWFLGNITIFLRFW